MTDKDIKILLKIVDPETNQPRWVHLCYADGNTYAEYLNEHPNTSESSEFMNTTLSRWAKEDFDIDLAMDNLEDMATLKSHVKELYREKYPEIYRDSNTDRQGWLRLWVNNKMKEDMSC